MANPRWVTVTNGPLYQKELFLAPESPAYWNKEMLEGRYDDFIYNALANYGSIAGATIWDVGAHIGYHSLTFASMVGPTGRVIAFEPNPHNFKRFQMNLDKNPDLAIRISLMKIALSGKDGLEMFRISSEIDNGRSSGSHLEKAIAPEEARIYQSFNQIVVPTAKADTLIIEKHVPIPSIIKIDIEGAELLLLEGGSEMLASFKPLLFIEIHNVTMMFYVQQFLNRFNYELTMLPAEHSTNSRCFVMAKYSN